MNDLPAVPGPPSAPQSRRSPMRRLAVIAIVVIAAIGGAWLLLGRPGGGPAATPDPSLAPVPPSTEVVADGRVVPARYAELGAAMPGTIAAVLASATPLMRSDRVRFVMADSPCCCPVRLARDELESLLISICEDLS